MASLARRQFPDEAAHDQFFERRFRCGNTLQERTFAVSAVVGAVSACDPLTAVQHRSQPIRADRSGLTHDSQQPEARLKAFQSRHKRYLSLLHKKRPCLFENSSHPTCHSLIASTRNKFSAIANRSPSSNLEGDQSTVNVSLVTAMDVFDRFDFVRLLIGCLLSIAGAIKLLDLRRFARTLAGSRLAPRPLVPYVTLMLPPTEMALGLAMVVDWKPTAVAGMTTSLFAAFAVAVSVTLRRSHHAGGCGCFGGDGPLSHGISVRNVGLGLLTLSAGVFHSSALLLVGTVVVGVGTTWSHQRKAEMI